MKSRAGLPVGAIHQLRYILLQAILKAGTLSLTLRKTDTHTHEPLESSQRR